MALDAARSIVRSGGLDALSTRKVAGAMGYTVGTLYLVYENLDALILALNEDTLSCLQQRMEAALADSPQDHDASPHAQAAPQLLALARAYIAFARAEPNLWRLIFEHRLPPGVQPPGSLRKAIEQVVGLLRAALTPLPLEPGQRDLTAQALWSAVHGLCILSITGKMQTAGSGTLEQVTEHLIETYLHGLAVDQELALH